MTTSTLPKHDSCPSWCRGHDEEGREVDAANGVIDCAVSVADLFLPEVRRFDSEHVTRAGQDEIGVAVRQVRHLADHWAEDTTVDLEIWGDPRSGPRIVVRRLLPGEARELAAALVRAADMELFR